MSIDSLRGLQSLAAPAVDAARIAVAAAQERSWKARSAGRQGIGKGTAQRAFSGAASPFDFEDGDIGVLASASSRIESSRLSSHNSFR